MLFVNRYFSLKLKNYLVNLPKSDIFKVGEGGGKQISGIYRYLDYKSNPYELSEYYPILEFNHEYAKKHKLNVSENFQIEQREYHFNKDDKPFFGKFHMDLIDQTQRPCYTFVYYYQISPTIKGGELEFENKQTYKPSEFDIVCFDGDVKHKVNKLYGEGVRGTLIINLEKK